MCHECEEHRPQVQERSAPVANLISSLPPELKRKAERELRNAIDSEVIGRTLTVEDRNRMRKITGIL